MCKEYVFTTLGPTFQWNDVRWTIDFDECINLLTYVAWQDLFIEPKIFDHFPNSVSYKQLIHYGQIIKAGGGLSVYKISFINVIANAVF